jgi:two-component system chemotaxis response regulator CheB
MRLADAPIRVLLVDDSAVVRRFVTETLQEEPDIVVSATAANGSLALERLEREVPDVVVLDVEMPVLDGLATLKKLRPRWPDVPVVMYSTLTTRGATATLDALSLGAADYVLKPSQLGNREAAILNVRRELAPVLRSWGNLGRVRIAGARRPTSPLPAPPPRRRVSSIDARSRPDVVVIGSSTGGPHALTEVVPQLAASLAVPVLVVQHMPPLFTRLLSERLDARSALHVVEAEPRMRIEPGNVYVAPGGVHMVARRRGTSVVVEANDGPPENSCKPAVDVMFRSAVDVWGSRVLAVVLTGMGHDGLDGCRKISAEGGTVLVQDEATSVVWGMPGAVSQDGIADEVLALVDVSPTINRYLSRSFSGAHA